MEGNKKHHCYYTSLNPLHGAQYSLQVTAKRDYCFRTQVPGTGIPVQLIQSLIQFIVNTVLKHFSADILSFKA